MVDKLLRLQNVFENERTKRNKFSFWKEHVEKRGGERVALRASRYIV